MYGLLMMGIISFT